MPVVKARWPLSQLQPQPLATNGQTFIPHYCWLYAYSCVPVLLPKIPNLSIIPLPHFSLAFTQREPCLLSSQTRAQGKFVQRGRDVGVMTTGHIKTQWSESPSHFTRPINNWLQCQENNFWNDSDLLTWFGSKIQRFIKREWSFL